MAPRTGLIWSERCMWHDAGNFAGVLPPSPATFLEPDLHLETPAAKRRIKNLLDVTGLTDRLRLIAPRPATRDELLRVHCPEYLDRITALGAGAGGDANVGPPYGETCFGAGGDEIAALAAGGVLTAVDAVLDGLVPNAYALVRPPGHHARPADGLGFCIFNNAAVAAAHALEARGLSRVAVVDWDAHHGNGAQEIFWEDPRVLTVSIHQDAAFPPGSGAIDATGAGAGAGTNLNVPFPPGTGTGAYLAVMERVVVPALERFRPDLIIVPSGLDAGGMDPLYRLMLHSEGFREMTRAIMGAAARLCGGHLVMCHEGGYSRYMAPFLGLAIIEELSGERAGVEDPFLPAIAAMAGHELQPHQDAVLVRAEALARQVPSP